jgi:maltose-binding protein MalE
MKCKLQPGFFLYFTLRRISPHESLWVLQSFHQSLIALMDHLARRKDVVWEEGKIAVLLSQAWAYSAYDGQKPKAIIARPG